MVVWLENKSNAKEFCFRQSSSKLYVTGSAQPYFFYNWRSVKLFLCASFTKYQQPEQNLYCVMISTEMHYITAFFKCGDSAFFKIPMYLRVIVTVTLYVNALELAVRAVVMLCQSFNSYAFPFIRHFI